jgi:hypothetical protein
MNLDENYLEAARKNFEAGMDRPLPAILPTPTTVEPHIYPSTSYIAALDGTDQQMFFLPHSPDQGIAAWGVLYVELDTDNPHQEPYRDGPRGFLTTEDLFYYHLTMDLPNREESRRFRNDSYMG